MDTTIKEKIIFEATKHLTSLSFKNQLVYGQKIVGASLVLSASAYIGITLGNEKTIDTLVSQNMQRMSEIESEIAHLSHLREEISNLTTEQEKLNAEILLANSKLDSVNTIALTTRNEQLKRTGSIKSIPNLKERLAKTETMVDHQINTRLSHQHTKKSRPGASS